MGHFNPGEPSGMYRLDPTLIPQHSPLAQPRMLSVLPEAANRLDLTSAIAHELQRINSQPGWLPWNQQLGEIQCSHEPANGLQLPPDSLLSHQNAGSAGRPIPQYIPRFDEALGPPAQQLPTRLDLYSPDLEPLASAHQGFYSRADNGVPRDVGAHQRTRLHPGHQALDAGGRVESMARSVSPWIERMMQADVTPTPSPSLGISTSLSLSQRGLGEASCVASQTAELQSCHSSDVQRSAFQCGVQRDQSTAEASAELCTDDEDWEARPLDEKRKKRMLSNRASAQRSRQRRQERLDQLEVLTAQLRVENSTLQKKLGVAVQVAKKFEDENKALQRRVERLSKELESGKARMPTERAFDECASSQQTTCTSSCEMVGGRTSVDPNVMRSGNDGESIPSMSAGSAAATETETKGVEGASNGKHGDGVSSVRKSLSEWRMGKKRTLEESVSFGGSHSAPMGNCMGPGSASGELWTSSHTSLARAGSPGTGVERECGNVLESMRSPFGGSFGMEATMKEDASQMDCMEADRWLEFAECFK
ncbi:uncharacterized protein [Physcomitrium patens]|uniref:BZIP domain-containing protein n=2 Tax=Physcomitrium patens TaxID=3218 RepID=A0A2K1LAP8_PHYPA|nr:uncharacterized protein LOC112283346 isoform X1 [Physcomitrium patens]PNR63102.1 hypothetical protein PHYPA_001527 [Physcomitrium patens]|eukprot:XP_024377704.1 uncharacterized protein LOC112283346 isoform X1 [Physcomitrella patens]